MPYMPQFYYLALNEALSYNPKTQTGGPKDLFHHSHFRKLHSNKGLGKYYKMVQALQKEGNHITEILSMSDLIQIGGASSVEYCGGPFIQIKIGRQDCKDEHQVPKDDIDEFEMSFTDQEIVALFGRRTLGFKDISGKSKEHRWSRNPYVFDNNYFEELLNKNSPYIKTTSDLALLEDKTFKENIELYSQNQDKFFEIYVKAHQKMSELGCSGLLSEEVTPVEETLSLI